MDDSAFITPAVMLFFSVIISWQSLTGGDQGCGGIPRREIFGFELGRNFIFTGFAPSWRCLACWRCAASRWKARLARPCALICDNEIGELPRYRFVARPALGFHDQPDRTSRAPAGWRRRALRLRRSSRPRGLADPGQAIFAVMGHQHVPRAGARRNDLAGVERRGTGHRRLRGLVLGLVIPGFELGRRRGELERGRLAWSRQAR